MATPNPCPRCHAPRLAIIYYGAEGTPIGGHLECTQCGPRHAIPLVPVPPATDVQDGLLERKAS
jgi:hypothetical protein